MIPEYNVWNKWDKLNTVMLGDTYCSEFYRDIPDKRVRTALCQIADETQQDLEYFETVLKEFGCTVLRPQLDKSDSIMNYLELGKIPRSPLQPRDCQLVVGNSLFYTGSDHVAIKTSLDNYCAEFKTVHGPLFEQQYIDYKGNDAPDWPDYKTYLSRYINNQPIVVEHDIIKEFNNIHFKETNSFKFPVDAPCITVIGKDIYIDTRVKHSQYNEQIKNYYFENFKKQYPDFNYHWLDIGGHNDACFHTVKPGAIISLNDIQSYKQTFPNWDVCYLPDQSWDKVEDFLIMKKRVGGKWWVPGQEKNEEFINFVETWLNDWVGYVEETVFDVNVLVLDEHHVCVNNLNTTVVEFLKRHKMEPILVPWRHRYFWDGGLHCITLDLHRQGYQQNYF